MIKRPLSLPRFLSMAGIVSVALLCGCSTPPPQQYQVDTFQKLSHAWMQQADRKRQMAEYDAALALYQKAEDYAQRRNDRFNIGIAKLKRAAIHLTLNRLETAQQLIDQVAEMERYESAALANPVRFMRAKMAYQQGEVEQALALLQQLEIAYLDIPEKQIYYRLMRWHYQPQSVDINQVNSDLAVLDQLVAAYQLSNIEIYSFALLSHARWLTEQGSPAAETAINKALDHFASQELTAQIKQCYQLLVDYHRHNGNNQQADYFQRRLTKM